LTIKFVQQSKNISFVQSPLEHGLDARGTPNSRLLVGVYVDDLIVIGGYSKVTSTFKKQMQSEFKMSDLGPLNYYLGIDVH
jgi:hypothetical protein